MQTPLRGFQQKLVQAAKVGNHIIVLPTGTGKTRIVVELAHQMLQANPQSRIVVLTPTTTLAQQQQGTAPAYVLPGLCAVVCSSCSARLHFVC